MQKFIKELNELEEEKRKYLIERDGELFVKDKALLDIVSSKIAAKLPQILDALESAQAEADVTRKYIAYLQRRAEAGAELRRACHGLNETEDPDDLWVLDSALAEYDESVK